MGADLAAVDEHGEAKALPYALPVLHRAGVDGGSASRVAVVKGRSDGLVAVTADSAATSGIKALVGWQAELSGALCEPSQGAKCHEAAPRIRGQPDVVEV